MAKAINHSARVNTYTQEVIEALRTTAEEGKATLIAAAVVRQTSYLNKRLCKSFLSGREDSVTSAQMIKNRTVNSHTTLTLRTSPILFLSIYSLYHALPYIPLSPSLYFVTYITLLDWATQSSSSTTPIDHSSYITLSYHASFISLLISILTVLHHGPSISSLS